MNKDITYISFDFDGTLHQSEKLQNFVSELIQNKYHFGITTRRTNIYPNNKQFNDVFPSSQVMKFCQKYGIEHVNFLHLERKADFFKRLLSNNNESCIIVHIDDDESEVSEISNLNNDESLFLNNKKVFCFHISEWIEFVNFVRNIGE